MTQHEQFTINRRQALSILAGVAAAGILPTCTPLATQRAFAAELNAFGVSSLPDTDRGRIVQAYRTGGTAVRAAAVEALLGTDADVTHFHDQSFASASMIDRRFGLVSTLSSAGSKTRSAIEEVLESGQDAINNFLDGGYEIPVTIDLRFAVAQAMATGGRAVNDRASSALDDGSRFTLRKFLDVGLKDGQFIDARFEIVSILADASPHVAEYAERAIEDDNIQAFEWFLESGQFIARARDEENAKIEQLVLTVEKQGQRASAQSTIAVTMAESAVSAAEKARAAAQEARREAVAAEGDVDRSAKAARKAARAATGAAEAAREAVGASNVAQQAAQRAARASQSAAAAAATAGRAAASAYRASIAASQDASKAATARNLAQRARDAAGKALISAEAADQAAIAADQAGLASGAAASAASHAASAAAASAAAAVASGAAAADAAEARHAASVAEAAAARANRAANRAGQLANQAASAARTARDAARSAAEHAINAADAAERSAEHAGEAVDFANRSTQAAEASVEAAETARNAVDEATTVEEAARTAEQEKLSDDREVAIEHAREDALRETQERERSESMRTQEARLSDEVNSHIVAAETALAEERYGDATDSGRMAAALLLDNSAHWTREAAEFAISGTQEDVLRWITTDRVLALNQDDADGVFTLALTTDPAICTAATEALATEDAAVIRGFLTEGVIQAAEQGNRFKIAQILASDETGDVARREAEAALGEGTATAYHQYLSSTWPESAAIDDRFKVTQILSTGGPYLKLAAEVALDGSTKMRSSFVDRTQHTIARLDHDHFTHISAIRASISHAAAVASSALEDAARASVAAAEAREAAGEAAQWSDRADQYAADAAQSAQEAQENAEAAEQSAANAAQSEQIARQAAESAMGAQRTAKYMAFRASESAATAMSFSINAQLAATSARSDAIAAGKDADFAAAAASEARELTYKLALREEINRLNSAAAEASTFESDGEFPDPTGIGAIDFFARFLYLTNLLDSNNRKPVNRENAHTGPFDLLGRWFTGNGARREYFDGDDTMTQYYKNHWFTQAQIDELRSITQSGEFEIGKPIPNAGYSLGGLANGAGKFYYDTVRLMSGHGNWAYAYFGSHTITRTPIRTNSDGSVTWLYEAHNSTSIASATRPPVIGYTEAWQSTIGPLFNDAVGSEGPLSATEQTMQFEVTVP